MLGKDYNFVIKKYNHDLKYFEESDNAKQKFKNKQLNLNNMFFARFPKNFDELIKWFGVYGFNNEYDDNKLQRAYFVSKDKIKFQFFSGTAIDNQIMPAHYFKKLKSHYMPFDDVISILYETENESVFVGNLELIKIENGLDDALDYFDNKVLTRDELIKQLTNYSFF